MKCDTSGVAPLKKHGINYLEPSGRIKILKEQFFQCLNAYNRRAGPRTLECGGASGPDPEQLNTGYDVSGASRKGGEYERGSPPLI